MQAGIIVGTHFLNWTFLNILIVIDFQAIILLSLFQSFCTVEKEFEMPLVCEAVSCSVEEGSSKGTVGDYYLLLNSELFDWIMFRYHILQVIHLEFFVCQKINVFIIFTGFYGITLFCQYLNELFEMSLKV